jgi:nucleoside-diphosphate-sugar epimerase
MASIFITGASSRIGRLVAEKLASSHELILLKNRHQIFIPDTSATILDGGMQNISSHVDAIQSASVIIHIAGRSHADTEEEYELHNNIYTRQLLDCCSPVQLFIYISTRCVGKSGGAYGLSKLRAEQAIKESGIRSVIIRPAEIYDSNPSEGIDQLLGVARNFGVILDFAWHHPITYSPVSAKELAAFTATAAVNPPSDNRSYTICANREYGVHEIARALSLGLNKKVTVIPVSLQLLKLVSSLRIPLPFKQDQITRLTMYKSSDNSLAVRDYGFNPRDFLDYLRGR